MRVFLIVLIAFTWIPAHSFVSSSSLKRPFGVSLRCADEVEALRAEAAILRDEARSMEQMQKKEEAPPVVDAPVAEYSKISGSRWRVEPKVDYEGCILSLKPVDLHFLEDGYSDLTSESDAITKIWGWDVESDDGTNAKLGKDLHILLFSADVDEGSFSMFPTAIATEFQKSKGGPGRVYFTAVLSATDGVYSCLKGTLTVKVARKNGGWWGGDGILADFKIMGSFTMSSI